MTHCNRLPDPTGTRFFVSSRIFIESCKVIPLSDAGTSLDSFLWPETSCGTEHNLQALLQPIPRLDRCNRSFTRIPLLAKISSISVSTPENVKKNTCGFWYPCCMMTEILSEWTYALRVPLHHKRHQQYQVKNKTFFFCWSYCTVCICEILQSLFLSCIVFVPDGNIFV